VRAAARARSIDEENALVELRSQEHDAKRLVREAEASSVFLCNCVGKHHYCQ